MSDGPALGGAVEPKRTPPSGWPGISVCELAISTVASEVACGRNWR